MIALSVAPAVFASGLNNYEQDLLAQLRKATPVGAKSLIIPPQYVNQAENYFLSYDLTKDEYDQITAILTKAREVIMRQSDTLIDGNGVLDFGRMPYADKKFVLQSGIDACKIVGLLLTYDKATDTVKIVSIADPSIVYFENTPLIKTTGSDMANNLNLFVVVSMIAASIIFLGAASIIYNKKRA